MIVVGVTGSFASGKTETVRLLRRKGARVFDADAAARKALEKRGPAHQAVFKLFGKTILKKNGNVDRKKLADRVFRNPKELKKLNILIHPGVIFECLGRIARHRDQKGILALDVPLLFESKMDCLADVLVVVASSRAVSLKRAAKKGIPATLARKILASQWPTEKKTARADFVIRNDRSLADLKNKVSELWTKLSKLSTQKGVVRSRLPRKGE